MSEILNNNQGEYTPLDEDDVKPISQAEIIESTAFIGEYPLDIIIDGIQTQFSNYMEMEDKTNYVDIFYDQLHKSYENTKNPNILDDVDLCIEALDKVYDKFISVIKELFDLRLSISIMDLEDDEPDGPNVEYIVRRMYDFFILGAEVNFKVVLSADINSKIQNISTEEREYFKTINGLLETYNPLISTITPTEFLQIRGDREIYDLFENGRVSGNFLRKYTPKLYQNISFQIDLVNYITGIHQFHSDLKKSWEDNIMTTNSTSTNDPNIQTQLDDKTKESITNTIPGLLSQIDSKLGN